MGSDRLRSLLERGWEDYSRLTPDAGRIHALLEERGERIVNDHVAFRTFDLPGISRLELGAWFEAFGYERRDDMDFPEKKLRATYWLHPDPTLPKIFISELELARVGPRLREWIRDVAGRNRLAGKPLSVESFLGDSWDPPALADYEGFYSESEYAAWTAAFGIRVNHFTVSVNALQSFRGLSELNKLLLARGFELNRSGGVIKGARGEGLEQSSTVARRVAWRFAGGREAQVMSCYYEFAERFEVSGALFQGFIPRSADKIFESTFEPGRSGG